MSGGDAAVCSGRQVRVVISAEVPLQQLFSATKDTEVDDDKRALMDDLRLTNESVRYGLPGGGRSGCDDQRNVVPVRIGVCGFHQRPPPPCRQLTEASIFTGEEELFAFDRTVSRLAEMQTAEYWARWEQTAA